MAKGLSLGKAVLSLFADTKQFSEDMKGAEGHARVSLDSMQRNVHAAGLALAGIGGAMLAPIALGVKSAMDFGKAMGNIATLGVKEMQVLERGIKDVARTFGTDLVQTAEGAYQVISATGYDGAKAIDMLTAATKAAVAGGSSVSAAVELGTGVMNAFGMQVSELEKIYDQAFTAVKDGVTNFDQLAGSVGRVAPVMAAAGLSTAEMFGAVTALTKGGIATSEAVSGLKAALANIIKPGGESVKVANALGIEFTAVGLRSKGLAGFLADVKEKIEQNGPAVAQLSQEMQAQIAVSDSQVESNKALAESLKNQVDQTKEAIAAAKSQGASTQELETRLDALQSQLRAASSGSKTHKEQLAKLREEYAGIANVSDDTLTTMASLFGSIEGLNVILALTGEQSAAFTQSMQAMAEETWTTQDAFNALAARDPGLAFRQLKSELQVLSVEIGEGLLPTLKMLLEAFKPILSGIVEFVQNHQNMTAAIVNFVASVGSLSLALGSLMLIFGPLVKTIIVFKGILGFFSAGGGIASVIAGLTGTGSAAAGAGAGAAAAGAGFVAAAVSLGLLAIAAGVVAAGVVVLGVAVDRTIQSYKDLAKSEEAVKQKNDEYVASLKARGVVIDETKLKEMGWAEQRHYLHDREKAEMDTLLTAHLDHYLQREATETEFAVARNLKLNEWIDAEEAAILVTLGLSQDRLRQIMRMNEEETETALRELNIRGEASIRTDHEISDEAMLSAAKRKNAWLDSAREIVEGERQTAEAAKSIWSSFASWFQSLYEWVANLAKKMLGMGAQRPGPGPTQGIPHYASGGVMPRNGLAIVGEHGREPVFLRQGDRVMSNSEARAVLRGAADNAPTVTIGAINVSVQGETTDARALARHIAGEIYRDMGNQLKTALARRGALPALSI